MAAIQFLIVYQPLLLHHEYNLGSPPRKFLPGNSNENAIILMIFFNFIMIKSKIKVHTANPRFHDSHNYIKHFG